MEELEEIIMIDKPESEMYSARKPVSPVKKQVLWNDPVATSSSDNYKQQWFVHVHVYI